MLTQALLRAQNIPTCAAGYIYDVAAVGGPEDLFTGPIPVDGMSDITGYPHVWNEAYVDGEWVTLDTTWDSLNIYNGEYIKSEYPRSLLLRLFFNLFFPNSCNHRKRYRKDTT